MSWARGEKGVLLIISCCLWLHVLPLMAVVATATSILCYFATLQHAKWQMEPQVAATTTVWPGGHLGIYATDAVADVMAANRSYSHSTAAESLVDQLEIRAKSEFSVGCTSISMQQANPNPRLALPN